MSYNDVAKVVFVGDNKTGKTAFKSRIANNSFDIEYRATVGVEFLSKTYTINEEGIKLELWDTPGQPKFSGFMDLYLANTDLALIFCDLSDITSYNKLESYINTFLTSNPNAPIILVGSKSDLEAEQRVVTEEMLQEFAKQHNCTHAIISSKTGEGIEALEDMIATKVLEHIQQPHETTSAYDKIQAVIDRLERTKRWYTVNHQKKIDMLESHHRLKVDINSPEVKKALDFHRNIFLRLFQYLGFEVHTKAYKEVYGEENNPSPRHI